MRYVIFLMCVAGMSSASLAKGAPSPPRIPAQVSLLLDCQKVTEASARLACYDRASASLSQSLGNNELTVVDRAQVRSAKRSLFGFSIPTFGIFGGDDKDDVKQLEGVIASVSQNHDGGYVLLLQDGSQWSQTDDRPLAIEPRRGDKVVVHRAALGSFMLNVGRMPGIRVKRVG